MIRDRDWTGHPLDPPQGWPDAPKVALSLMLKSSAPMILAWDEGLSLFNDTYFDYSGRTCLGRPERASKRV